MSYGDYLRNKYHHAAVKIADAEGVPCVLEYSKGKNIRNYEIYGNSVQDGTPSVDSPVEIQSVGDLTTKNILKLDEIYECTYAGDYFPSGANMDKRITSPFTESSDYKGIMWLVKVNPNTTYTFSTDMVSDEEITIRGAQFSSIEDAKSHYVIKNENKIRSSTFTTNADTEYILIGKDNADLSPITLSWTWAQLEEGSTATEYEPYHKYDIPITVTGKNLLKYPYYWNSRTRSGITFTVNGDGTVTLNGTTTLSGTSIDDFTLAYEATIESGTYTVSGCPKEGAVYKYRIFLHIRDSSRNSRYISDLGNGVTFTVTDTSTMTVSIRIGAEIGTVNNLVFAPQIELGSTATEYEPYKGETKHIYFDEPLRKVENYADYIDFKNQKVVRNVEVLDDTGTKTISESFGTLATPTEESIALPALKTFKGKSIISADTTVLPSNIKVKYVRT